MSTKNKKSCNLLFVLLKLLSVSILYYNFLYTTDFIIIKSVGDVMLGSVTPKPVLPTNLDIFDKISSYLSGADIVLCNLEGSFITENMIPEKYKLNKKQTFVFGMPVNLSELLIKLNFNVISFNNNHVMDYGKTAYEFTQQVLSYAGLHCATKEKFATIEVKNLKIAVVAFSFTGGVYSIHNISRAKNQIVKIKQQHDIVIVSFHGGAEGEQAMNTKDQTEYFLGENRGNVIKFAHAVVDAGADLVVGHGPHVLRAVEVYKNKLIAYSLGNFLTYGNFNLEGNRKYSGILEVQLNSNGELIKANFIPTLQVYPGIPMYDDKKNAIHILNSLGKTDFPNTYYKFE